MAGRHGRADLGARVAARRALRYHIAGSVITEWGPHLVRTQIQLTEAQSEALRAAARREGTSVAAIIRQAVAYWLRLTGEATLEERRRAAAEVPAFATGLSDLAERHDHYLTEESA